MSDLAVELLGTRCRCGKEKGKMMSFCVECCFELPASMRRALYRRFGEGYEEAYAAAVKRLIKRGLVKEGAQ